MLKDVKMVRMIMEWLVRRRKIKVMKIEKLMKLVKENKNLRFMNESLIGIGV